MRTIILFARAPCRGRVKTRLAREIGEGAALGVYVAMLRDAVEKARFVAREVEGEAVLAFTPARAMGLAGEEGAPSLRELWSGEVWLQPEGDLGARMQGAIAWAMGRGASAVALVGADVPDMSASELKRGFEILGRGEAQVVLGAARDGGFWTMMCSRPVPREAFELDWNRDETLEPLLQRLQVLGIGAHASLASHEDVDDAPALARLGERLRGSPGNAPHTEAWLRANGRW